MGLLSSLFGGKKTQTTTNGAYDLLNQAFSPALGYAGQSGDLISKFLGGDTSGFDTFKDATGFNTALSQGLKGVTGAGAAKGLLRSGATGQAFEDYGEGLEQQFAGNYLNQLLGLGNLGLSAGQVIGSAAPQTTTAKGGGGLGKALGTALGMAATFSDRRLKTDVERVGEEADGLGRYRYRYLWDRPGVRREGVMADEVAALRPWALGPIVSGFATVRYGRLAERRA